MALHGITCCPRAFPVLRATPRAVGGGDLADVCLRVTGARRLAEGPDDERAPLSGAEIYYDGRGATPLEWETVGPFVPTVGRLLGGPTARAALAGLAARLAQTTRLSAAEWTNLSAPLGDAAAALAPEHYVRASDGIYYRPRKAGCRLPGHEAVSACVVVKVDLRDNNLRNDQGDGPRDGAASSLSSLEDLPYLQYLDVSGNALGGIFPRGLAERASL